MHSITTPTDTLIEFVRDIGLTVHEASLVQPTFLPGLLIARGQLVVDRQRLLYPGDILHEAGHLAVTPAAERPSLGGNITENHPEKEGEELAVLAWSYAAAQALELPTLVVFHPAGYKGQSEWLAELFDSGQYPGLPLLAWMGLTLAAEFPRMHRWLRD
ncbi:hypothetical protein [Hymenobacter swuensis]|uniref:Uncharacterized protein n=1 Tax=Hymenobacter swuensis DY53 TaxID=1227739 RepID=W8F7G1_9BACT|nr:hypothetical protein [Hymenobacter swuensis]AHJ98556.1 hypothetical protein Hsw_2961 [Hymenobacter swuensis DY53]